eukprot:GHUV01037850.1.p1 GENE.GHUV01037850.1~~GHUV01037850.1.p1  ORF type:complete len:128 (+),score=39.77 GHUV01037850.1:137-520(+)
MVHSCDLSILTACSYCFGVQLCWQQLCVIQHLGCGSTHSFPLQKCHLQELDHERSALRHQQKQLQHQHGQLQADQAAKQTRLSELNDKCRDVQMLKFGQVIDVSLLDTIGIRNKGADELKETLKQQV